MSVLIGWFIAISAWVGFLALVVAEYRLYLVFGWKDFGITFKNTALLTLLFAVLFYVGLKLITTGTF